jgi:head-tail adaptor
VQSGRYDRLITIQRATMTQSASGEPVSTWVDIAARVPAQVTPTRGDERVSAAGRMADQEQTFVLRFLAIPAAFRPLSPRDRILYPVDGLAADVQAPPADRVFDVVVVDEIGRQVDLKVRAVRRTDVVN